LWEKKKRKGGWGGGGGGVVEVRCKRGQKYIKEGMTERRNKTEGGKEEYRKK